MAAFVRRLAGDLDVDPEKLAEKIGADNVRRLKYPVVESKDDDGRAIFKHPRVIG